MFIIPNQITKKHLQENINDLSGTIYSSRNIDLDEEGYIKLASPTMSVYDTDDDTDFNDCDAMYASENQIYLNSDEVFAGEIDFNSFANKSSDTNAPSPSVEEDVIYFNGTEVVSDGSSISYKSSASAWTDISMSGFNTGVPTVMASWESEGVLAVGNDNKVKYVDTSWAVNATELTLPSDYQVSSLITLGSNLYIGTRSKSGAEAMVFVVTTIQVGIDFSYGVGTFEVFSIKPFKSSIVAMVSNGKLLRFTGGGFEDLAKLPIYKKDLEWADANNDYSVTGNRAMVIDGDLVYVNLSSLIENGKIKQLTNFHSGVWCYDDANGSFYHRYALTGSKIKELLGSSFTVDATANTFTLTSGNLDDFVTGMPLLFNQGAGTKIEAIRESKAYYLIKDSSTVFKVATTYANAIAGTAVDLDTAGNTSQRFYILKTNDYGMANTDNRLCMAVLNSQLFNSDYAGRIALAGNISPKNSMTSDLTVMCGTSPYFPNRGYFTTPRLNSAQLQEEYTNVYVKHFPLVDDDKIIIKYKDIDKAGYPFSSIQYPNTSDWEASWTSDDTFTTTADLSAVVEGEEIEIISGVGSGHIAFITSISESSGTYTVELDEAFPFAVSGNEFRFNVDTYKKIGEITALTQDAGGYKIPIGRKSKFVQVKIEMRGIKIKIEELIINNKTFKNVV